MRQTMNMVMGLISPLIKLAVIWALAHWVVNTIHYVRVYEVQRIEQFQKENQEEIDMKFRKGDESGE